LADQRGHLQFAAASNERVERLEFYQIQNHEGPCSDAFRSGVPVVNAHLMEADEHWPGFVAQAAAVGIRSVHAIPLRLREDVIGAMGVFGQDTGLLSEQDAQMARALAHVATIGLLQERTIQRGELLAEQLQSALNSRIVIEQAKGALAERAGVSVDTAFLLMRDHARRTNRLLGELARAVLTEPNSLTAVAGTRKERGKPR